jgi:hypothetical protein
MTIRPLVLISIFASAVHAEETRTIERNLSTLANVIIPIINLSEDTTILETVDFLNLRFRETDPPPPRNWKLRLEVSEAAANTKFTIVARDMNLHQILGKIADTIDAEIVVTRTGYIIREKAKQEPNEDIHNRSLIR